MIELKSVGIFFIILIAEEAIATFVFWLVSKIFRKNKLTLAGVLKGVFERLFIYFSLVNGIFHSLTLFGALKIATHIKDDDKVSNEYFLIGNLISVLLAISNYLIYQLVLG